MCHCALRFHPDGRFIIAVRPQRAVGLVNALHKCQRINLRFSIDIQKLCHVADATLMPRCHIRLMLFNLLLLSYQHISSRWHWLSHADERAGDPTVWESLTYKLLQKSTAVALIEIYLINIQKLSKSIASFI